MHTVKKTKSEAAAVDAVMAGTASRAEQEKARSWLTRDFEDERKQPYSSSERAARVAERQRVVDALETLFFAK